MRVGEAHKRREKAKKSGGISNNNAKIPTYHDSLKGKGKGKRQKTEDRGRKTEDRRQKTEVGGLLLDSRYWMLDARKKRKKYNSGICEICG